MKLFLGFILVITSLFASPQNGVEKVEVGKNKFIETTYANGVKHGVEKEYMVSTRKGILFKRVHIFRNGKKVLFQGYKRGNLIKHTEYNDSGKLHGVVMRYKNSYNIFKSVFNNGVKVSDSKVVHNGIFLETSKELFEKMLKTL